MLGLTSSEVYNSIFKITEKKNKFELYADPLDSDFSFNKLKDKVGEVLGLADITIEDLEYEIFGPKIIKKTHRKISTEKSQTDGYYKLILNYMHSSFRDFESYLGILKSLDENDIQLV